MKAEWIDKGKEIKLIINGKELTRKPTKDNTIRFKTKAPKARNEVSFTGIIEGEWLWIYPFMGPDTFNNHKVKIK